jgi:hypothetical protein
MFVFRPQACGNLIGGMPIRCRLNGEKRDFAHWIFFFAG